MSKNISISLKSPWVFSYQDEPTKHLETIENSMQIKVLLNRQHIQELGRASESKIILDLESYT